MGCSPGYHKTANPASQTVSYSPKCMCLQAGALVAILHTCVLYATLDIKCIHLQYTTSCRIGNSLWPNINTQKRKPVQTIWERAMRAEGVDGYDIHLLAMWKTHASPLPMDRGHSWFWPLDWSGRVDNTVNGHNLWGCLSFFEHHPICVCGFWLIKYAKYILHLRP